MMRLSDTLTSQKLEFRPSGDVVKVYVCGVTPYAPAHVGHAMSYIYFDVLRRYLEYSGYEVRHVQNFTDIDDKIINAASANGVSCEDLADSYISEYFEDMDALNVTRAHAYPRATQEIDYILFLLQGLIDSGAAYTAEGDVYFRVTKFDGYGKLSHRDLEGMMAGARVEVSGIKEHPMDFVLWKSAKPGEPSWESPWGPGRPGWHIECSAMSLRYLGEELDIHGGGQDLVFPHHENEIAQSETFTNISPFSRFWLHNGLLQFNENKMSKSLGNLVTVREALGKFSADAIRLFFLSSHYRNPLAYSEMGIAAQEKAVARLRGAIQLDDRSTLSISQLDPEPFKLRFLNAMDDDLNTPRALAVLFDLTRDINKNHSRGVPVEGARELLILLAQVLGLTLQSPSGSNQTVQPFVDLLIEVRDELRSAKLFELADGIRDKLKARGIILEDTSTGGRWTYQEM